MPSKHCTLSRRKLLNEHSLRRASLKFKSYTSSTGELQRPTVPDHSGLSQDGAQIPQGGEDTGATGPEGKALTARQQAKQATDNKARLAAEEAKAAAALRGAKKLSKAQRDREADTRRGPPPSPKRNFRAPAALLPDIIITWELLHVSLLRG